MFETYARNSRSRAAVARSRGDFAAAALYDQAAALFLAGREDLAVASYRAARGY